MDDAGVVQTSFNLFDVTVISIIGLSALLSFFRGFVREVLSLGAWVGASIITLYTFPDVANYMKPHLKNSAIASGFAAMGTFMISLLAITLFNSVLMRFFKKGNDVGVLDNLLGLGFGVFRAFLLVSLGYFTLTLVMSENDYPAWLASSKTKPYVEKGALVIARLAPDYLDKISPLGQTEETDSVLDDDDTIEGTKVIEGTEEKKNGESGYDWMNVEELERLIDNTQNNPDDQ